jgi:hypothetical protein
MLLNASDLKERKLASELYVCMVHKLLSWSLQIPVLTLV